MATGMVSAFGMDVAVGMVIGTDVEGTVGSVCVSPGLAMYIGAQLERAGVAGAAQPGISSEQRSRMKQRERREFTKISGTGRWTSTGHQ